MTVSLLIGFGLVLVGFVITGYAIWQYGPGLRERPVVCPLRRRHAHVLADQRESEFGNFRVVDVQHCSLLNGAEVSCGKSCLKYL